MTPDRAAGGGAHVLHVEHIALEVLIEDAGLDIEGDLRRLQLLFQVEQVAGGCGDKVKRIDQPKRQREEGEDRDDTDEAEGPDAAGAHCRDLGVGGQAAKAEQDAGEDGGWDSEGQGIGQHVSEDAQYIGQRRRVADDQIEDLPEMAHEEHKGEEHSAEQGVGDHFAKDVSGEDAHFRE